MRELRYDNRGVLVDGHRITGSSLRSGRISRVRATQAWHDAWVTGRGRGFERETWWAGSLEEAVGALTGVECATLVCDDDADMGVHSLPVSYWLRFVPPAINVGHLAVIVRSFQREVETHAGYLGPLHAEAAKVRPSLRLVVDRAWLTSGDLARRLGAAVRQESQ